MEQGDGLDELFGEPFRQTGELPAEKPEHRLADPTVLPVAPGSATLPLVGSTPPAYGAAPYATQATHMVAPPVSPPVAQPPSFAQPNSFDQPVQPTAPPQPVSFTPAVVSPQLAPPVVTPVAPVRRDPNAPFDFQLRPRREYPRTTAFEWSSLAFAIVVPPVGLVLSIIARGIARRQQRWRTRVAGVATSVSVILSLVLAGGAGVYLELQRLAAVETELALATAPLCNLEDQVPGTLASPTLGWPAVGGSIPESVASIEAYYEQWNYLARVLPPGARADAAAVATATQEILGQVDESRTIDDPANVARMTTVISGSGIANWAAEYCR